MPDWALYDLQLRQFHADGVTPAETARRLNLPPQTVRDRLIKLGLLTTRPKTKKSPPQEEPMPDDVVEVLPGQISIADADTPGEVQYDAVGEFDALPEGYAKTIQPMRAYTEAEEFALNKSMELYGFQGAIIRDQYGRILDGNQRQRIARLRGLGVPYTITQVRDDAHATEIARALNAIKRHYPREQRMELVQQLREQGFSSREMAVALGVSQATVIRDIWGAYQVVETPQPEQADSSESPRPPITESPDSNESPGHQITEQSDSNESPGPRPRHQPKRIQGRDKKSYPAQRPSTIGKGQAEQTRERMGERDGPNSSWINVLSHAHRLCSSLKRLPDLTEVLEAWGPKGRLKAVSYLRPLHDDIQQLLSSMLAIDARPQGDRVLDTSQTTEV